MTTNSQPTIGLKTLEDGQAPETRMEDAQACQDFVRQLINNDDKRSQKRARVAGLVDGNAPYNWRKLREAGSASRCNVNWGSARAYLENGSGAFYDLSSQSPGFVEIVQSFGETEQEKIDYSRIMSRVADELFADDGDFNQDFDDCDFDQDMQLSQNEMVLYGSGPLYFENEHQVFPISVESGDLLVPNRTRSKTSRWEFAAILWDYYPPELFAFIENEKAAKAAGWDVDYTKSVIENAVGQNQEQGKRRNWEWYQNELKSNSFSYRSDTRACKVAHCFWKEFDGRITHAIVERTTTATTAEEKANQEARGATRYLFLKVGRYANFKEAIHPMYCDRGRGGYHHNVTGQGVKLFGPMEYENRLLSNQMDKAFAPKTLFKATTQEAMTKFQLAVFSDYAVIPPGIEVNQNPIQGFLQDGLAMYRTSADLIRSNLSSSRQQLAPEKPGNPVTAFEKRADLSQESSLSQTTFNRYYKQLDQLYAEIVRRMCLTTSTDERAKEFQRRCVEQGMPEDCFQKVTSAKAVRVIGSGSPFMRSQVIQGMMPVVGRFPEDGQNNWLNDFIASSAGQNAVARYNPQQQQSKLATDQKERAMNQVAGMKIGLGATVTSSQNALTFASVFLQACVGAIQSVQQGADPANVVQFINLAASAALKHIKRMATDETRKDVVKALMDRWKQVAQLTDKLKQQLQQQAQQQQAQKQKAGQQMTDAQLKAQKVAVELQLKKQKQAHQIADRNIKTRADLMDKKARTSAELADKGARTRQDLAIKDATAASDIHRKNAESESAIENAREGGSEAGE